MRRAAAARGGECRPGARACTPGWTRPACPARRSMPRRAAPPPAVRMKGWRAHPATHREPPLGARGAADHHLDARRTERIAAVAAARPTAPPAAAPPARTRGFGRQRTGKRARRRGRAAAGHQRGVRRDAAGEQAEARRVDPLGRRRSRRLGAHVPQQPRQRRRDGRARGGGAAGRGRHAPEQHSGVGGAGLVEAAEREEFCACARRARQPGGQQLRQRVEQVADRAAAQAGHGVGTLDARASLDGVARLEQPEQSEVDEGRTHVLRVQRVNELAPLRLLQQLVEPRQRVAWDVLGRPAVEQSVGFGRVKVRAAECDELLGGRRLQLRLVVARSQQPVGQARDCLGRPHWRAALRCCCEFYCRISQLLASPLPTATVRRPAPSPPESSVALAAARPRAKSWLS
eukprot:scaffold29183_cov111-Isochrysis_galbana.AAC.3